MVAGQVIRKKDQRQTQSPELLLWSLALSGSHSFWRQQTLSPLPSHQAPSAAKETGGKFINRPGWCQTLEISQCMLMPSTLAEMYWIFTQAYSTLTHLWRKERLYYWYKEIVWTKSSKQQQLSNKCSLWADSELGPESTRRTQSRPCAKEAADLGGRKGQNQGPGQL